MLIDYYELGSKVPLKARQKAINAALREHLGSAESACFTYTLTGEASHDESTDALHVWVENSDHAPSYARRLAPRSHWGRS